MPSMPASHPSDSAARMTGQPCFVRVTGTRDARFVEFEFAIGDPELAVELVLLFDQFREFCTRHEVRHLTTEEGARLDFCLLYTSPSPRD